MKRIYFVLGLLLIIGLCFAFSLKTKFIIKTNNSNQKVEKEINLSKSTCDEIIKNEVFSPVKKYEGKPTKVDFSTYPDAKLYYSHVIRAETSSPNFAGHFFITEWGCGTDCEGFAVIDSITGKIIEYTPFDEDGNMYFYDIDSRLLVLNPKNKYEDYKGKKMDELIKEDVYGIHSTRKYYKLIEKDNGEIYLDKFCTENAFDGISAL